MKLTDLGLYESYTVITDDKIESVIKQYLPVIKKYIDRDSYIYRGMIRTNSYVLVNGDNIDRVASETHNFVNSLTSYLPSWQGWPKRTNSIICTTSLDKANYFGNAYVVIPLTNQEIAFSKKSDFWQAFKRSTYPNINVDGLNKLFVNLLRWFDPQKVDAFSLEKDPVEFIKALERVREYFITKTKGKDDLSSAIIDIQQTETDVNIINKSYFANFIIDLIEANSAKEFLNNLLDPSIQNTLLHNFSEIPKTETSNEIWFTGKALCVHIVDFLKFVDKVKKLANKIKDNVIETSFYAPVLDEGINDKYIFKAIFTAGGPASGKTLISNKIFKHLGFKEINVDRFIEFFARKKKLDLKNMDAWDKEIFDKTDSLHSNSLQLYLNGRLPLLIDGTGRDTNKIKNLSKQLEELGYETGLLFVNTSLKKTIERNKARNRTVDIDFLKDAWLQVQGNIGELQNFFGNNLFIYDNSNENNDLTPVSKRINAFINRPVSNSAAIAWTNKQQSKKVTEAFDTTMNFDWTNDNDAVKGYFTINDTPYAIEFLTMSNNNWKLYYGTIHDGKLINYTPTGMGGPSGTKVLGAVVSGIVEFIKTHKPNSIRFEGHEKLASIYEKMTSVLNSKVVALGYTTRLYKSSYRTTIAILKDSKISEHSSSGSTASSNVATNVGGIGVGFDPEGDFGVYPKPKKKKTEILIRR
jgi:predicted kinase